MIQQSLKQEVDTMVHAIRAEVAVADGGEANMAVEEALQVRSASHIPTAATAIPLLHQSVRLIYRASRNVCLPVEVS